MKDICVQKKDGPRILVIRGQKVILDQDLASLYRVTTVSLNQAVRRNPTRFPTRFVLVVTRKEFAILISQNVISSAGWGGRRKPPMAFTEHGALMVASVLNSARAISMSIYVIEAFIKQREELATSEAILKRLAEIDRSLMVHDEALQDLYNKLLPLLQVEPEPKQRAIGFGV